MYNWRSFANSNMTKQLLKLDVDPIKHSTEIDEGVITRYQNKIKKHIEIIA